MPNNLNELAAMIAKRDSISIEDARESIRVAAMDMEEAFFDGNLDLVEDILSSDLGLEPDYLMLFIN